MGELRAADPSNVQGPVKQNASPGDQSKAPRPRWKPGHPGPENQDSQHMLEQPRGHFPLYGPSCHHHKAISRHDGPPLTLNCLCGRSWVVFVTPLSVPWSLRPQNRAAAATCGHGRCELPAILRVTQKSLAASDFFAAAEAKNPAISAAELLRAHLRPLWSLRFCDAIFVPLSYTTCSVQGIIFVAIGRREVKLGKFKLGVVRRGGARNS